ncbi:MAG: hypothetical protein WBV73_13070 [Phormidium sp.]
MGESVRLSLGGIIDLIAEKIGDDAIKSKVIYHFAADVKGNGKLISEAKELHQIDITAQVHYQKEEKKAV